MRKAAAFVLALAFAASAVFPVCASDSIRPASYTAYEENEASIVQYGGWHESLYVIWENDGDAENAKVYVKRSSENEYSVLDAELVRKTENGGRADAVGLAEGSYDIKVVLSNGTELVREGINVDSYDRSGYAHFGSTAGVGAYNDDGTPKANADIIYVDNENKNDVEYNGKKGIASILASASSFKNPLIVRFVGTVDTQSRDEDGTKTTDIKKGVIAINGLTDRVTINPNDPKNDDSYLNMCDITSAKNITLEGIGADTVIEKWGFTFYRSSYIEVRNLRFAKYPEDACSFIGDKNNPSSGSHVWLHNCTFDKGENKYDVTYEQDKHEGDGSTDIAWYSNITIAYNRFNDCHKTSLNGNGDSVKQYNITWHHNYFNNCGSRMPLVRQSNVHSYNNYFYNTGNACIDARASAWVFSEANYFEKCSNAYRTTQNSTEGDPIIKSFNDVRDHSTVTDNAKTINYAETRGETYTLASNKNPYPNFDTDEKVFYYKNGASDVELMQTAEEAKKTCIAQSGVMTAGSDVPTVQPTVETTTETTTYSVPIEKGDPVEGIILDGTSPSGENSVVYRETSDDYYITDTSNNATTTWEIPFEEQESGVIVIEGSFTPYAGSSKWAVVQVKGTTSAGKDNAVAAIASDSDKYLCLRANDDVYTQTYTSITAGVRYDYKFVIDLDSKTAALTLGGQTVSSPIDVQSITCVYFMTASTAKRDIAVTMPYIGKVIEASALVMGDVNLDGDIMADDSALALQYTLNKASVKITEQGLKNADVDSNMVIDSNDSAKILQKALVSTYKF